MTEVQREAEEQWCQVVTVSCNRGNVLTTISTGAQVSEPPADTIALLLQTSAQTLIDRNRSIKGKCGTCTDQTSCNLFNYAHPKNV